VTALVGIGNYTPCF